MVNPPRSSRKNASSDSSHVLLPARSVADKRVLFTHPRFISLASLPAGASVHPLSIHPAERASPFAQVAVEGRTMHPPRLDLAIVGSGGSSESPLAGSTGCGHTTIPATISLFLFPSLSLPSPSFLLRCLASFVPLHRRSLFLFLSLSFSLSLRVHAV